MKRMLILTCTVAVLALPALAQEPRRAEDPEREVKFEERLAERLRKAVRLPGTAEQAREAGVPEEEVKQVLESGKTGKIPAGEMQEVLEEENKAAREHGTIDNFGSFVQEKLDQGLRGRELADAIHQEHAARGKGKYKDKDKRHPGKGKGKAKGHAKKGKIGDYEDAELDDADREHDDTDRDIRERAREADEHAREAAAEAAEEAREAREKAGAAAKSRRGKKKDDE